MGKHIKHSRYFVDPFAHCRAATAVPPTTAEWGDSVKGVENLTSLGDLYFETSVVKGTERSVIFMFLDFISRKLLKRLLRNLNRLITEHLRRAPSRRNIEALLSAFV
uniref:Uncharacterized protein n=1 Tax=Vespula pensylvanica TaxID=30213 RepID=A0A834P4P5_VESPE|nr:hypothetical protein H0235_005466 [Vespula pensylvanica]